MLNQHSIIRLVFITCECNNKILKLLHLFQIYFINMRKKLQNIYRKINNHRFGKVDYNSCTKLQNRIMHIECRIQEKANKTQSTKKKIKQLRNFASSNCEIFIVSPEFFYSICVNHANQR